jgi:hypothetical protein
MFTSAIAAMLANFNPSKDGGKTPALLKHSEVVTYFHELGHVFHNMCTTGTVFIVIFLSFFLSLFISMFAYYDRYSSIQPIRWHLGGERFC